MSKYDLIYYCESYPAIGNGHLKRGLDITNLIIDKKPELNLAICGKFSKSANKFLNNHINESVSLLDDQYPKTKSKITILDTIYPGDASTIPKVKCKKLKPFTEQLFAFNTGIQTKIPEEIDGIFNYIPITKYSGNTDIKKFFGTKFAPVSKEFVPEKEFNLNKNILCIIGGNKNQYGPRLLSEKLTSILNESYKINFILSPHYPENKKQNLISKFQNINYRQNVERIKPFMEESQSIITTYGNATWECMTLHRPTFIVSYLDFQKYFAQCLNNEDLAVDCGYLDDLNKDKLSLIRNKERLVELEQNLKKNFDKPGILNIVNTILEELNVSN